MERKLTVKSAANLTGAQVASLGRKEKTDLCIIMGAVMGTKINDHPQYGAATGFIGSFRSISMIDGEVKEAPVFWPYQHLAEVIQMHRSSLRPGDILRLNVKIGVKPDEESNVGYTYFFDFVEQAEDTVDLFRESMEKALAYLPEKLAAKLLPAPADEAPTEKAGKASAKK